MTTTPIQFRDLTRQAPHSPRVRVAGFAVAVRAVDKCLATIAGQQGEYHYDCPLDNVLFSFKGITGGQFQAAVIAAKTYEEVGAWLLAHGTPRTPEEIKVWSDDLEARSPIKNPAQRDTFIAECQRLGLNPATSTAFDRLDADDRVSFLPARA